MQTKPSAPYSASPTHLPVGWEAERSAVKASQPHGWGPFRPVHVIPSAFVPFADEEKHPPNV